MTQSFTTAVELPAPSMEVGPGSPDYLDAAFALCEDLARTHYENFSVGSRLIPKRLRRHFYSIYAFSRGVDDIGDEAAGDRLALLDLWEQQLNACYPQYDSSGPQHPDPRRSGVPTHPYFVALSDTIRKFDIPIDPFKRLIEANRRDQQIVRHETYDDLLDYCTYSANPVGHLVLYLGGHREPEMQVLSDHICTALQLTNFWQDVKRDYEIGRIYIPLEDLDQFGVSEEQISEGKVDDRFRALMRFQVDRARELFAAGYPLSEYLGRSLRSDLALFTRGGLAVLRAIERQGYDVLSTRPTLSKLDKTKILTTTWLRSRLGLSLMPASAFKSSTGPGD
ncbi:MAG: squalene synthase HpnC [Chloroflexi bacterium]|nr:squalene synthase HpnC [Chloroflexota bacterium]